MYSTFFYDPVLWRMFINLSQMITMKYYFSESGFNSVHVIAISLHQITLAYKELLFFLDYWKNMGLSEYSQDDWH